MEFVEDKFKIYIDIEQNIGIVYFEFQLYELENLLYSIDTKKINNHDKNISIFDGKNWTCIDDSGLIDTNKFKKICIEYDQLEDNIIYNIEYKFKENDNVIYENNFDYSIDSNKVLQQTITIPVLIYHIYPTLYWYNSFDLDGDDITYELDIFDGEKHYTFNVEKNDFNGYSYYKLNEESELQIKENVFYFWKVRAFDGLDYSDWSNINCFLYINRLEMQLLLCKKEENDLNQEIYVKCNKQLLDQEITVKRYIWNDLEQSIFVKTDKQMLNQTIEVFSDLLNDLEQSIFVKTDKQMLNFSSRVVNRNYNDLEQSIFVKTDKQMLFQQIAVCSYDLKMMLWVVDTKLHQKLDVKKGVYDNLNQTLQLRGFSQLNFEITKIEKFEQNLNQTIIIKLPYYDELIINAFDQNNIEIFEKEWVEGNRNIFFDWTKYTNENIYYKYTISMNQDDVPDKILYNNSISFIPTVSGIWFLKVRAYLGNNPIHEQDSVFVLYINTKPSLPQPPFLIDGILITENTEIYNTLPLITFNGAKDADNDILDYHIKISDNIDFENCYVDTYVDHESTVNYQLKPDELLPKAGLYYLYIATCDYTPDGIKKSEIPIVLQFRLSSLISVLEKKLRVYYYSDSLLLFMKLQIPRYDNLYQNITVSNYLNNNIDMKIRVFKDDKNSDLNQEISVYKGIGLDQEITVYHNYYNLNQEISVNKSSEDNLKFSIRVYHYNSDNFKDDEFPTRDIYQQVKVYFSTDNPNFTPQPLNMQLMVAREFSNSNFNLNFSINVWNMYHNPYFVDIGQKIIVSNIVMPPSGILYSKITLIYENPPNVIITANIPENVWQREYMVNYNFQLDGDYTIPISGYYYEFDNNENTIPTTNSNYTPNDTLRINLKNYFWRGRFYLHVRAINNRGMLSEATATYCILYNLSPSSPTLPLLVNGYDSYASVPVINYTRQINFTWGESYDPDLVDKITYKLQITSDPTFSRIDFEQSGIIGNTYGMVEKTLPPATYYWRVLANDGNENSAWSLIGSFFLNSTPEPPQNLMVKNIS